MAIDLIAFGLWAVVLVPSFGIGLVVGMSVIRSLGESRWGPVVGTLSGLLAFAAGAVAIGAFVLWLACAGIKI